MPRFLIGCLVLSLFCVPGCGGGGDAHPYTDHSQDAEAWAKETKVLAVRIADGAKTSREPADVLRSLVEHLENPHAPKGNYETTYTEMLNIAKPLMQECEQAPNGKPSGLNQKLDQIVKAAEPLPGEVSRVGTDEDTAPVTPLTD
jgi:hypothetical protein